LPLVIVVLLQLAALTVAQIPERDPGSLPIQPRLGVDNITFSEEEPLEGETLTIWARIVNNDTLPVANLTVHFLLDQDEIGNATALSLEPRSAFDAELDWIAEKWTHAVTVTVDVGGQPIPGAMATRMITVKAEPVGDVPTLLYMLGSILAVLVGITLAPSISALARR
jgi:hypothetical protein